MATHTSSSQMRHHCTVSRSFQTICRGRFVVRVHKASEPSSWLYVYDHTLRVEKLCRILAITLPNIKPIFIVFTAKKMVTFLTKSVAYTNFQHTLNVLLNNAVSLSFRVTALQRPGRRHLRSANRQLHVLAVGLPRYRLNTYSLTAVGPFQLPAHSLKLSPVFQ